MMPINSVNWLDSFIVIVILFSCVLHGNYRIKTRTEVEFEESFGWQKYSTDYVHFLRFGNILLLQIAAFRVNAALWF